MSTRHDRTGERLDDDDQPALASLRAQQSFGCQRGGRERKAMTENRAKTIRCKRCGKRCRNRDGWNDTWVAGVHTGYLCPDCQTPKEDLEAQVRETSGDGPSHYGPPLSADTCLFYAERFARQYRTPEEVRRKADELEAARKDEYAQVVVGLMRATAEDMEAGWRP
jgi:hypothetical protein